ncbi:hypothetical protein AB0G74_00360 [Streptomyces sp. NPDC020875]|uniref:hypothetical protein n=1 Tax=Streptomyces sp. NPDC020875 TaxID=3154898 RepID=UPI00340323E5
MPDAPPSPGRAPDPVRPARPIPFAPPPETYSEITTRLRPVPARRPVRTVAAVVCAVLGLGLIGGAATAGALTSGAGAGGADDSAYDRAHTLWHTAPVDALFPRTLRGEKAGPGKADRVWTRIAVAPDGDCASALDPKLAATLTRTGCARVVRATYTDATSTHVTTVGLVFTGADEHDMASLSQRVDAQSLDERPDLMPRAYGARGTVAERFGPRQRASWALRVLPDVPVVVYAVSGFADGRIPEAPQPAATARDAKSTSPIAQAGLGHEAVGVATGAERALRSALDPPSEEAK